MNKSSETIYLRGKGIEIYPIVMAGGFLAVGIILAMIKVDYIFLIGMIFLLFGLIWTVVLLISYRNAIYALCDEKEIKLTNVYKKVKRVEKWEDLKFVQIKKLNTTGLDTTAGTYIVLYFTLYSDLNENMKQKVEQMPHIIIIYDSPFSRKELQKYLPERFKGDI